MWSRIEEKKYIRDIGKATGGPETKYLKDKLRALKNKLQAKRHMVDLATLRTSTLRTQMGSGVEYEEHQHHSQEISSLKTEDIKLYKQK